MPKITKLSIIIFLIFSATSAYADDKFLVDGTTLYYDSFKAKDDINKEITFDDTDVFKKILSENKIQLLILNSDGGFIEAAYEITDLLIDFEVDTHIKGECFSACYWLFLAGESRTMEKGSRLGFHQSYMTAEDVENHFIESKDINGWANMYEYTVYLYGVTQDDIFKDFEYQLERGVKPSFIIQTIKVSSDQEFYPRRKVLVDAGVLTD